jgi:PAS domain-containing protein
MEDQVTAQDRNVKESEEQYSPRVNRPHPSASLLDERASKLVESLHEGMWLINRKARTVFVQRCLVVMFRYDVEEMIGQSLCTFCDERFTETLRHNLQRRRFGVAEQCDYKLVRKDTGLGIIRGPDTMFQPVRVTKERGVGLDLTIFKRIAEAIGGRIYVASTAGSGLRSLYAANSTRQMKEGGVHSWKTRPS